MQVKSIAESSKRSIQPSLNYRLSSSIFKWPLTVNGLILLFCSFQMKPSGHPEDNHSDTSRETVTSDSGRGGSEDDLPVSHNNSKGKLSETIYRKCL